MLPTSEVQPHGKQERPLPSRAYVLVRETVSKKGNKHDHCREEGCVPGKQEKPGDTVRGGGAAGTSVSTPGL